MVTAIIAIIVFAIVGLDVWYLVRSKRQGKSSCSGCSGCSGGCGCSDCSSQPAK